MKIIGRLMSLCVNAGFNIFWKTNTRRFDILSPLCSLGSCLAALSNCDDWGLLLKRLATLFHFLYEKSRTWRYVILTVYCAGLLAGCSSSVPERQSSYIYGQVCSVDALEDIVADLKSDGVEVSYLGDYIYLVFPTDRIFPASSGCLENHELLDNVTTFLRCQQKISVHVVVYSDVLKNTEKALACPRLQAQRIMKYLWQRGIDARLLTVKDGGQSKVAGSGRRVEISTQKLP